MLSISTPTAYLFTVLTGVSVFADGISSADFQTTKRDKEFAEMIATLDLEAPEYVYHYKSTGTSVGLKVEKDAEKLGKYMPVNAAADPESQRVSYSLGRFLSMSELVPASTYFTIRGRTLEAFKQMLLNANEKNHWRKYNQDQVLLGLAKNPNELSGIFVGHIKNNAEVLGLADPARNTINPNHPIAKFIRADGPMPTTKSMNLAGVKTKEGHLAVSTEIDLARQFSKIMVLDALTGQWDRWSGGNVEAVAEKSGRARFIARDNGGAGMIGTMNTKMYFSIVTRFDRDQVLRLQRLQELLALEPETVAKELELRSDVRHLKNRVSLLLEHIERQSELYGEAAFF